MQTIALATQKGGAGKSTLCVHLAALVDGRGRALALRYMMDGEAPEQPDQELALSMARDIEAMALPTP